MPIAGTFYSNAPHANTGYGTQTRQLVPRMIGDGHKIAIQANYGVEASLTEWQGIPVYPRGYDQWCNDMIGPSFDDWTQSWPDHRHVLFGLFDVWVVNSSKLDEVPVIWWTPVDHHPAPPGVIEKLDRPNWTPVAMSQFGYDMMRNAGLERARYAPHAIDTSLYRHTENVPLGEGSLTGRQVMGLDESDSHFVVASFDANKSAGGVHRKAWGERLLAFSIFAKRHSDAVLYIHSERHGAMGGCKFDELIRGAGINPAQVRFVNQWALRLGIPDSTMAALYSAADVVLMPSLGEGFGLVALEAQSTGSRVILNDSTAQTELCGPDSYLVNGQPLWDDSQSAWWSTPNVGSIVEALEDAYNSGRGPSMKNRRFAQQWDADKVYREHWRPILLEAQQ
jgi:hypothetical protein